MERDEAARERILRGVMTEIHHLPLPTRRPRYGAAIAGAFLAYAVCMVLMWVFKGPVVEFWQWLIGTLWVSMVEWAVTSRWGGVDMVLVLPTMAVAAWMIRTRGHKRG